MNPQRTTKQSHTKEPWHTSDYPVDNISGVFRSKGMTFEDWQHAVRCVNGCAGLTNDQASRAAQIIRECVEALDAVRLWLPQDSDILAQVETALRDATQEGGQ